MGERTARRPGESKVQMERRVWKRIGMVIKARVIVELDGLLRSLGQAASKQERIDAGQSVMNCMFACMCKNEHTLCADTSVYCKAPKYIKHLEAANRRIRASREAKGGNDNSDEEMEVYALRSTIQHTHTHTHARAHTRTHTAL